MKYATGSFNSSWMTSASFTERHHPVTPHLFDDKIRNKMKIWISFISKGQQKLSQGNGNANNFTDAAVLFFKHISLNLLPHEYLCIMRAQTRTKICIISTPTRILSMDGVYSWIIHYIEIQFVLSLLFLQ